MTEPDPASSAAPADAPLSLPDRPPDAHKGTFGTVVVVGGSAEMIGAPAIAAGAALRIGCGLARIAADPAVLPHCLTIEPSATGFALPRADREDPAVAIDRRSGDDDVLAIGPGLGRGDDRQRLVEALLRQGRRVVLDADGLNNLAEIRDPTVVPRCPLILTPHPGEFRRLAGPADVRDDPVDPDQRPDAARHLARAYNAVCVLKGAGTIVSDGDRCFRNTTGNPALATAGSGDVLTGAIAGLLAQGLDRFHAACLAVHLHGLAADLWAREHGPVGLAAQDLIQRLPHALAQHRRA